MSIRILLADDHKIVRDGLRTLLEQQSDMEVVGEAEDGRTTVQRVREQSPDVVIMDIAMPDLNGIEATRQILSDSPGVKVIALSMLSERQFVVNMLKAGASGYMLKDCAFEELALAIRTVVANHPYLSPQITGIVIEDYMSRLHDTEASGSPVLTNREREVLQLLSEGHTVREIASQLHVSVKTVETHRQQIMHKLNIHTVAELTKYALREGLTSLEF